MNLIHFQNLLKESMGLDVASIGASAIERAVRERQRACRVDDLHAYWTRVRGSDIELQALIDAAVVTETWFFRDREAFTALGQFVRDEWLSTNPEGTLRMLSLPCSTGEEPYSMAMALLDAGVPADRFRVDAVDISERALARGRRSVYGKNSFRGTETDFRDRYFEPAPFGHRICDTVRRHVNFKRGNLFNPTFVAGVETYSVIFSRNVLIYFDRPTQDRAIDILSRLMTATGCLFVGSSETGVLLNHDFVPAMGPMTFAFRKASGASRVPKRAAAPPARRRSARQSDMRPATSPDLAPASAIGPAGGRPSPQADAKGEQTHALDEVTRLANEGRFVEAATRCEEQVRQHGPSAEAFQLLGLVRDACGEQSEAAVCYRKALYLDPHNQGALVHLALLMDKLDHKSEAQLLRSRARRIVKKSAT